MLTAIVLHVLGAGVLLLFVWPKKEKKQERAASRCACSNCECNGETIIIKEKKK